MTFLFKRLVLVVFALAIGLPSSGLAAEKFVKTELNEIVSDFDRAELSGKMFQALDALLKSATKRLRAKGHRDLAAEITEEWVKIAAINMSEFGVLDLGDHEPLSRWLARTHDRIEAKLGKRVCRLLHFSDIKVLNFAIPVVFRPRGSRTEKWDRVEYQKHFVPFSGVVTYWAVNGACQVMAPGLWVYGCGAVSEIPRFAVEKWIAPHVSNRVYAIAHGGKVSDPSFSDQDLEVILAEAEAEISGEE